MVTQLQGFMLPNSKLLGRSFSNALFLYAPHGSTSKFHKYLCGNIGVLTKAAFGSSASSPIFDEESFVENGTNLTNMGISEGLESLELNKKNKIVANHQTYIWLLDGYVKSGSFPDSKKLHGKILKSGFGGDHDICTRLIDAYAAAGDLEGAVQVFDDMLYKSVSSWNKLMLAFSGKKLTTQVLGLYTQMLAENVNPDESTFAYILRAKVDFQYVRQVHGKAIRYGFGTCTVVCNPLVDLYTKNGFLDTAKNVFNGIHMKDNVSWVAMISGFSQSGQEIEAILLFCEMHKSGIFPTPYVFSSVISACTKIQLFKLGEQLHTLVYKWGLSSETFVCNAFVTLYSRSGNLMMAEQIFRNMQRKDGVSYNSLISGLAQRGFSQRSLQLYEAMQLDHLKPDCVTIASLLSACASVNSLYKGRQLHSYAIKAGMTSDIIIEGSLLDLYVKCSDVKTAHKFFLMTQTENVVLWNVMLVAYGQMGDLAESLRLYSQMQIEGMCPNQYTYPSILRTYNIGFSSAISACAGIKAVNQGRQIHAQSITCGYSLDLSIGNALVSLYARCGRKEDAYLAFNKIDEKDNITWNGLISGFSQSGHCEEALQVFSLMNKSGLEVNMFTYGSAVSAAANTANIKQGMQIHSRIIKTGYSAETEASNGGEEREFNRQRAGFHFMMGNCIQRAQDTDIAAVPAVTAQPTFPRNISILFVNV
uniref:Pentacotripeptide-repeat region of PRORP domain-containing protein n=1 Tax=Daucus carota subsp. sativus TaxID=79200 RepID=A0A162AGZ2_DAUCS